MTMLVLLQLSIAAIALFVTYASVYGLGALFASIAIPVMIAGAALEAGKYVAVSYAYQHWAKLRKLEASLLVFFTSLMMVFTSAGVFAYLGQGYQSSFKDLEQKQIHLRQLEEQRQATASRIANIDKQIAELPSNSVTGRIRLIREYEKEKQPLTATLQQADQELLALKKTIGETEIHAGPITYIASAFGVPVSTAATWIILALTICLDPFALFLSVLLNKLILLRRTPVVEGDSTKTTMQYVVEPVPADTADKPIVETPDATTSISVQLPPDATGARILKDDAVVAELKTVADPEPESAVKAEAKLKAKRTVKPKASTKKAVPAVESEAVTQPVEPSTAIVAQQPVVDPVVENKDAQTPLMDTPLMTPVRPEVNESTSVVIQRGGQKRK